MEDTLTRIPAKNWRYVPTETNLADLASRGVSPRELSESKLWWQVPEWLLQGPEAWPHKNDWRRKNDKLPELRTTTLTVGPPTKNLITRFSSHKRMLRVLSWYYRFGLNLKKPPGERFRSSTITLQEIKELEIILIRQSQERYILPRGNRMPQEQPGAVQEELSAATETLFGSRSVVESGRTSQMHGLSHHTAKTSSHPPPKRLSH